MNIDVSLVRERNEHLRRTMNADRKVGNSRAKRAPRRSLRGFWTRISAVPFTGPGRAGAGKEAGDV